MNVLKTNNDKSYKFCLKIIDELITWFLCSYIKKIYKG